MGNARKIDGIEELEDASRARRAQHWGIAQKYAESAHLDNELIEQEETKPIESKHGGRTYTAFSTRDQLINQMRKIDDIEDKMVTLTEKMYRTHRENKHLQTKHKQKYEDRTRESHGDSQNTSRKRVAMSSIFDTLNVLGKVAGSFPTVQIASIALSAPVCQGVSLASEGAGRLFTTSYDSKQRAHEFQQDHARNLAQNFKQSGHEEDQFSKEIQQAESQRASSHDQLVHDIIGSSS